MRVCITGTPGTGKTSVARELGKRLGWKAIGLNELAEGKGLYCGFDRKRGVKVVDVDMVRKESDSIKGNVILESHYAHEMTCDKVVVLRAGIKELRKRGSKKGWNAGKIDENGQAEIMGVCKQEAWERGHKAIEIDTTGKTPGQVADRIIKELVLASHLG